MSKFDPLVLSLSVGLLVLVALVAAGPPALRAASIKPMRALRTDYRKSAIVCGCECERLLHIFRLKLRVVLEQVFTMG